MSGGTSGLATETVDGQKYYVSSESDTMEQWVGNAGGVILTQGIFETSTVSDSVDDSQDDVSSSLSFLKVTVDIGEPVTDTNGTIGEDGKTVTWMLKTSEMNKSIYAYSEAGAARMQADTEKPVISGVQNGKSYKTFPAKFKVQDNIGCKSITVNGTALTDENVTTLLKKNKKNTIVAVDAKGNKAQVSFYMDTKAPTVKGIKNGGTYHGATLVYVKDTSGIQSVKVNGKKAKLTKVKKGKYKGYQKFTVKASNKKQKIIVTDKVGNKKTLKVKMVNP
jgi:hypothetical protein